MRRVPVLRTDPTKINDYDSLVSDKKIDKLQIRVGEFFRKLTESQKHRYYRIMKGIARKYELSLNQHPVEMILIRQIALSTVRIEAAEAKVVGDEKEEFIGKVEAWIFKMQEERRNAINTLHAIIGIKGKKREVQNMKELRGDLRDSEGLPETEYKDTVEPNAERYARRDYDNITRSTTVAS
jgi:hypothetical protein